MRNPQSRSIVDVVVLALVAVPAAVLGLASALAVRLTSPGPILFRQERIGRDGVPFTMLKFRTMLDGPNPIFPDASRITSAGRVLRRFSLDELPQLINVARGEMSIVGPRPTLAYQVERYDAQQRRRLEVRPGLTGLAQVSGRNELSWARRIDLVAAAVSLGLRETAREDDRRAGFALAHGATQFKRLLEGHPHRRRESTRHAFGPEQQHIHALIGLTIVAERPGNPTRHVGAAPWLHPGFHTLLKIANDPVGNPRIDIHAFAFGFPAHVLQPPC